MKFQTFQNRALIKNPNISKMMGTIIAIVTLVCPTLFSKNPINIALGKDAIKTIKIHGSGFSVSGLLSLSLSDIFLYQGMFLLISKNLYSYLPNRTDIYRSQLTNFVC